MTRFRNAVPVVFATLAISFSCVSCIVPISIWDMSRLHKSLIFYAMNAISITIVTFLVLLAALVISLKSTGRAPTTKLAIVLIVFAFVVTAYVITQSVFFWNRILSSVQFAGHTYYLTEHSHLFSFAYRFYECDHLVCHRIPLQLSLYTRGPDKLHVDMVTNTLYVLDARDGIVYEHRPSDP